jgi:hypothetical protein
MNLEVRWSEEAEFTFDHIVSFIQVAGVFFRQINL